MLLSASSLGLGLAPSSLGIGLTPSSLGLGLGIGLCSEAFPARIPKPLLDGPGLCVCSVLVPKPKVLEPYAASWFAWLICLFKNLFKTLRFADWDAIFCCKTREVEPYRELACFLEGEAKG